MRTSSNLLGLVGLTLLGPAATARAQEAAPVAATSAAPAPQRKLQLGVSFLPMALGKFSGVYGGMAMTLDAAFAPGVAVSVGYEVIPGLTVGLAPQGIFNVKPKEDPISTSPAAAKEVDVMARVAYAYPIAETITLYAEVLPGYSLVIPSDGDVAKGFVLAAGAGVAMDLTDRTFVSLGGGYQIGYQSRTDKGVTTDVRPKYVRVALGVGWRF